MQNKTGTMMLKTRVEVHWKDASTRSGWDTIEEYFTHGPAECVSVGYIIDKDENHILITQTQSVDGQSNSALSIPSPWVLDIVELTPTKAVNKKVRKKSK